MKVVRNLFIPVALVAAFTSISAQVRPQTPTSTAQQPAQSSNGVVVGQVIDATTNRPMGGVTVTLSLVSPPRPPLAPGQTISPAELAAMQAAATPKRVMTDSSGAFVFHTLTKGSFRLTVDAPGYLNGGYGQTRPNGPQRQVDVDPGERRNGIVVRMWPQCSISGTVNDELADPAVSLQVRLLRVTTNNGQRRFTTAGSATTDDRGAYRFGQLAPGEYIVAVPQTVTSVPVTTVEAYLAAQATPRGMQEFQRNFEMAGMPMPSTSGVRIGNQQVQLSTSMRALGPPVVNESGKTFAYATVYYPSAYVAAEATPVTVSAGQEKSGIDLQLRTVQTVRVSGAVTGPEGPVTNLNLRLIPGVRDSASFETVFDAASTTTDAFGAFTFPSVPSGTYTLRAIKQPRPAPPPPPPLPPMPAAGGIRPVTPPTPPAPQMPADPVLWGQATVAVNDTDVTNLAVTLRTGARISGRIIFEGSLAQPTPEQLQRMTISVTPADGSASFVTTTSRANSSGQFNTVGYTPGRYTISASGSVSGWYLKGATLGGKNLDEEGLDLGSADVGGVTITFTDRTQSINGTVRDPAVLKDMAATIIIFPANFSAMFERGLTGRRTRSLTVGGAGAFQTSGLAAGEYLIAAVNPEHVSDVRDKAFYEALARIATRFTLSVGETKSLDLTVSPIR